MRPFRHTYKPGADMTRQHLWILALIMGGISLLQWFVVPPPAPVRTARLPEEIWKLPQALEFDVKEALVMLGSSSLWGKLADMAAPDASLNNTPEWRFLGAIARGKERQVIIKIDGQPEQRLVPGDTLPGGSEILGIENDRLCLLVNGQKRSLTIYPQGPLSGSMSKQAEEMPARLESGSRTQKPKK